MNYLSSSGKRLHGFSKNGPVVLITAQMEGFYTRLLVCFCLVVLLESDNRCRAVHFNMKVAELYISLGRTLKAVLHIFSPAAAVHAASLVVRVIAGYVGLQISLFPSKSPFFNQSLYGGFILFQCCRPFGGNLEGWLLRHAGNTLRQAVKDPAGASIS